MCALQLACKYNFLFFHYIFLEKNTAPIFDNITPTLFSLFFYASKNTFWHCPYYVIPGRPTHIPVMLLQDQYGCYIRGTRRLGNRTRENYAMCVARGADELLECPFRKKVFASLLGICDICSSHLLLYHSSSHKGTRRPYFIWRLTYTTTMATAWCEGGPSSFFKYSF